jgi:4-amino-4-deoxy-L-arabinose transferase-like glycosyltransferase
MFSQSFGSQISWLLPAALIVLVGGLWATRRAPRTDLTRAGLVLWGGSLVGGAAVFSYMQGIIHEYYTIEIAPSLGATVAIGAFALWRERDDLVNRIFLAAAFAVSGWWAYTLLGRVSWQGWLRVPVLIAGLGAAALVLYTTHSARPGAETPVDRAADLAAARRARFAGLGVAALAGIGMLAGPTAYVLDTVNTPHTGATPLAGPANRGGDRFGGGGFGGLSARQLEELRAQGFGGTGSGRNGLGGGTGLDRNGLGGGGFGGGNGPGGGTLEMPGGAQITPGGGAGGAGGFGGFGGLGGGETTTENGGVTALLEANASKYRWVAAVSNSMSAASLELATGGDPVMAMGGFSGSDPAITLAQFQQYVAQGKIHYFVGGGGGGRGFGGGSANENGQIATWVEQNFKSVSIGGQTLYDLTSPVNGGRAS